jgi:hypothetical protein
MSVGNGMEGMVMNGPISPSPNLVHAVPVRTPSVNGSCAGLRQIGVPQGVGHDIITSKSAFSMLSELKGL